MTAAVALAVALCPGLAIADPRDHDTARHAVERGEIKTLADILTVVRNKLPGEVVGVKIERQRSRWYYELRVADSNGRLFEVHVDAQSGAIDRIREK